MMDILSDTASIHSFDTILPSYSEATLPSYSALPPAPLPTTGAMRSSTPSPRIVRPPPVPAPQILSISQSNLPLRFNGPQSHGWNPKIVYPTSSSPAAPRRRRPGAELNIFFRARGPSQEPMAHGDTSDIPVMVRRASSPRTPTGRSFEEEVRMRELDELTRRISRGRRQDQREFEVPAAPAPSAAVMPLIGGGGLPRGGEARLLGEEWDIIAVEAQREEIVLRISELESQFFQRREGEYPIELRDEIASLQGLLSARREDIQGVLQAQIARLRELKTSRTRVSHGQKDQIKTDIQSMKAEITFLELRIVDLEKFGRTMEEECERRAMEESALENDSKNWDLWFETNSGRR